MEIKANKAIWKDVKIALELAEADELEPPPPDASPPEEAASHKWVFAFKTLEFKHLQLLIF